MDTKLVQEIRRTMDSKPTDELSQIYQRRNEEEWSAETFEAIRQILLDRGAVVPAIDLTITSTATTNPTSSGFAASLSRRYSDAYTEAHTVVSVGKIIKGIAIFLSIAILLVGFAIAFGSSIQYAIGGAILACIVGIPIYTLGILIAAQGQTALATLDTAVNSSRHLGDDDVAQILSKRWSL